jgi:uncharacterized protein YukE
MPTILGAELDDLVALSSELARTTSALGQTQSGSAASTNDVVQSVKSAAAAAEGQITTQMDSLRGAVGRANASASTAVWTGRNAERFRAAYQDFDASMQKAETATRETFNDFRRAIDEMARTLADYTQTFSTALSNAQSSTQSMQAAVDAQRQNLDQVMNTGLTVG